MCTQCQLAATHVFNKINSEDFSFWRSSLRAVSRVNGWKDQHAVNKLYPVFDCHQYMAIHILCVNYTVTILCSQGNFTLYIYKVPFDITNVILCGLWVHFLTNKILLDVILTENSFPFMQNPVLTEKLPLQTYQGYQWQFVFEEKVEN